VRSLINIVFNIYQNNFSKKLKFLFIDLRNYIEALFREQF